MNQFREYVQRDTEDDGSVRFAEVTGFSDKKLSRYEIRDIIADAASAFCFENEAARKALLDIGGFDIGDLANHMDNAELHHQFGQRGLTSVEIKLTDFWIPLEDEWYYDYCLVGPEEFEVPTP